MKKNDPFEPTSAGELIRESERCQKIKVLKKTINLVQFAGYEYHIRWNRIDNKDKLVEWIAHLSEKTWCTSQMIWQLIHAACEHHGMEIYVNA